MIRAVLIRGDSIVLSQSSARLAEVPSRELRLAQKQAVLHRQWAGRPGVLCGYGRGLG